MSEIVRLKIKDIENESSVKRLDFYDESIIRLAESIKNDGLLTPITVYRKDNGKYELVMGERRLRASKYLEYEEIDAIVLSEKNKEPFRLLTVILFILFVFWHKLELMEISSVKTVYFFLYFRNRAEVVLAADISVQHSVSKA